MQNFAYGDPSLVFPYAHKSVMHSVSDWTVFSHMRTNLLCIRLVTELSPYAYGDTENPRTRTGVSISCLSVCIRCLLQSPYAYGDYRDTRMHTGIDKWWIPVCVQWFWLLPYAYGDCNNHRTHMLVHVVWIPVCIRSIATVPVCIRGLQQSPYAYGRSYIMNPRMHTGSCNSPRMHTVILLITVRIW